MLACARHTTVDGAEVDIRTFLIGCTTALLHRVLTRPTFTGVICAGVLVIAIRGGRATTLHTLGVAYTTYTGVLRTGVAIITLEISQAAAGNVRVLAGAGNTGIDRADVEILANQITGTAIFYGLEVTAIIYACTDRTFLCWNAVAIGITTARNHGSTATVIDAEVGGTWVAVIAIGRVDTAVFDRCILTGVQDTYVRCTGIPIITLLYIQVGVATTRYTFRHTTVRNTAVGRTGVLIITVRVCVTAATKRLKTTAIRDTGVEGAVVAIIAAGVFRAAVLYDQILTGELDTTVAGTSNVVITVAIRDTTSGRGRMDARAIAAEVTCAGHAIVALVVCDATAR